MNARALSALVKLFVVIAVALNIAPALAASSGSGSGFGLQVNLQTVPLLGPGTTLQIGPAPFGVNGSAPPDFDDSGTVIGVSGSLFGGAVSVGSGTLNASTESVLLGNTVMSSASVENLNLVLVLAGLQAQSVTSSATTTCTGNVSPPINTSIGPLARPDLDVRKFGPQTAALGAQYSYSITISNIGTAASSGQIIVTDNVPDALTINSAVAQNGFSCVVNGQMVTCTSGGVLPAGSSNVLVVVVTVTSIRIGSIENTAIVDGGGDDTPTNNVSPPVVTELVTTVAPAAVRPIPVLSPTMLAVLALLVALFAVFGLIGGTPRKRD